MRIGLIAGLALPACIGLGLSLAQPTKPAESKPTRGQGLNDPDLPPGFSDTETVTGLTGATALAVAPDGRLFVCEQTGALRVIKDDKLLPEPFLTAEVDSYWERGLIGVTLDPDFPRKPHVYVCYVAPKPYPHHVVSRFTARGDTAVPGSEIILLEGDDQTKLGGSIPAGHQGGTLRFGKDGKLFIGIGEQTAGAPAQRLDTFQGKLLRINPDGSIPEDNPFVKTATGKYRAIWALGLRNPFGVAVQPGTGRIFINDVGGSRLEEVNEGIAGANYGWHESEGPTTNPKHRGPVHAFDRNVGRSITGGVFYNPPVRQFPAEYAGKYFFMDYMDNWIHVLDPDDPKSVSVFATGLAGPVDIATGPDGSLYYLNRGMWVKDDKFRPGTGSVHRITYTAGSARPVPDITTQPDDLVVAAGQSATFGLAAKGEGPLSYQWFRDGSPLRGATAASLTLPAVTRADDGSRFRCVVSNALGKTRSRWATVRVLKLREPAAPGRLVAGVSYQYHEGRWDCLPDFAALKPIKTGTAANLDLAARRRDANVGFVFEGLIDIARTGVHEFFVSTSGAAKLFVGPVEVAGKGHSKEPREAAGRIALKPGKHLFRVLYAHASGRPGLDVSIVGPGLNRQALPESVLYRPDPAALTVPLISPAGGSFTGPVTVRLSAAAPGTAIRYTTDGSEPVAESPVYEQPFQVDHSATVRARSFRADGKEGSATTRARFEITGSAPFGLSYRDLAVTLNVPANPRDLPPLLSQTGVFRSLADLLPNPGIIPYDVNSPLWSDGAAKRRWVALPGDAAVGFAPTGEWTFPAGTVFIKHFEIDDAESPRRLETRLLVVDDKGGGYGVTYRWRPDQRDAELLADGITEELTVPTRAGPRALKWTYPSRNECLVCHTPNAGFVLGVKTRQLNGRFTYPQTGVTDNQLRAWNHLRLLEPAIAESDIPGFSRSAGLDDATASLEYRVRSYLDSNCAQCHRPGGARGLFDTRLDTPLAKQNLIKGPVAAADLGVGNARLIVPRDVGRSIIYERMNRRRDVYNMPPLATHAVDPGALAALAQWINSLPVTKDLPKGKKP